MQITCQECKGKFRIADEKIPEKKSVNITCPKCKQKIRIPGRMANKQDQAKNHAEVSAALPFDVFGDEQTALLCIDDDHGHAIEKMLSEMGYKTVQAESSKEAIKMTRFHPFDLAVVDETFESQSTELDPVIDYIQSLPMVSRRHLFVAYITDQYRTNDYMAAYCQSVNLIVNRKQLPEFKTVFSQAMKENDTFYSVYNETLRKYA